MDINTTIRLNTGAEIPQFGFGVWQLEEGQEAEKAILWALEAGYRHIDTAAVYQNEHTVGKAIKASGIPREEIFITTKIWTDDVRSGKTEQALDESLRKLDLDYVDLYLIHWPVERYEGTWSDLEDLYKQKDKVRAIGISNFKVHHLNTLLQDATVVPAVNQMEFNPQMQDNAILQACREKGIAFEAWSPFGAGELDEETMRAANEIGNRYGKSGHQAILRWMLQKDIIVFPRSSNEKRIHENADIFDFSLTEEEVEAFNQMNKNKRTGEDPDSFDS